MTTEPTGPAPLTDEDLRRIRNNHGAASEVGLKQHVETLRYARSASDVPRLLDEVERLRAELAEAISARDELRAAMPEAYEAMNALSEKGGQYLLERDVARAELADWMHATAEARRERDTLAAALEAGDASDGYHTHNELYEYRMLYNAHAAMGWLADGFHVVKSWYHSDGEPCFGGGWFVVVAELSTGQVTNHYREEHWGLFTIPEELPPAYDGHTPAEAADRLRAALGEDGGTER